MESPLLVTMIRLVRILAVVFNSAGMSSRPPKLITDDQHCVLMNAIPATVAGAVDQARAR